MFGGLYPRSYVDPMIKARQWWLICWIIIISWIVILSRSTNKFLFFWWLRKLILFQANAPPDWWCWTQPRIILDFYYCRSPDCGGESVPNLHYWLHITVREVFNLFLTHFLIFQPLSSHQLTPAHTCFVQHVQTFLRFCQTKQFILEAQALRPSFACLINVKN